VVVGALDIVRARARAVLRDALKEFYSYEHPDLRGIRRAFPVNIWNDIIFEFNGEDEQYLKEHTQWLKNYTYLPTESILRLHSPSGSIGTPNHVPYGEVAISLKFGTSPIAGARERICFGTKGDNQYIMVEIYDTEFNLIVRYEPYGEKKYPLTWDDAYKTTLHDWRIRWFPYRIELLVNQVLIKVVDDFPIPDYSLEVAINNFDTFSSDMDIDYISFHTYLNPFSHVKKDTRHKYASGTLAAGTAVDVLTVEGYNVLESVNLRTSGAPEAGECIIETDVDEEGVKDSTRLSELANVVWVDNVEFIDMIRHEWDPVAYRYGFGLKYNTRSKRRLTVRLRNDTATSFDYRILTHYTKLT